MVATIKYILLALCCSLANAGELFRDYEKRIYEEQSFEVDRSAAMICFMVEGTLQEVKAGKPEHGYTCELTLKAFSADKKDATDMCKSTFPHYIVDAEPKDQDTMCKFIIVNRCVGGYFLIYEKCYRVLDTPLTYKKAKEACATTQGKDFMGAQLAEYSSSNLGMDLLHMEFLDVWVEVPDLNEHFNNDMYDGGAVFVVKNAWQYETKEGVLEMHDLESEHLPLCEYSPNKTIAGVHHTVGDYNVEGMIIIKKAIGGFSVDTTGLCPPRDKECPHRLVIVIMNILGMDPTFAKFTNMSEVTFELPEFNRGGEGACDFGWFEYIRMGTNAMCHKVFTQAYYNNACEREDAKLAAFETEDEVDKVIEHFGLDKKNHYYLNIGAKSPCNQGACNNRPPTVRSGYHWQDQISKDITFYSYQWLNGMSTNVDLLYRRMWYSDMTPPKTYRGEVLLAVNWPAVTGGNKWGFVAFDWSHRRHYICSKWAPY